MSGKQPERDVGGVCPHCGRDSSEPLFLTYKQAAKKINISLSWLYHLLREGELTSIPLGPQVRRIATDECEAYAARRIAAAKEQAEVRRSPSPGSGVSAGEAA